MFFGKCLVYLLVIAVIIEGARKNQKNKKFALRGKGAKGSRRGQKPKPKPKPRMLPLPKYGLRCYNCLSYDHPGCWDPTHPAYANILVPSIDCHIPGMTFLCLILTSESAELVEHGISDIGPVRARTCVPAKDLANHTFVDLNLCNKLGREISESETFAGVILKRPRKVHKECLSRVCTSMQDKKGKLKLYMEY